MDLSLIIFYFIGVSAIFVISVLTYFISKRFRWTAPSWVFYVMITLAVYIFFAQYLKYQSLHFYVDFSHWAQLFYTIAKTGLPHSLNTELVIPGTLNYFSVHFVPLIYALAIPFKLIPRPETLLVLNVALMLSSVVPLYLLARRIQSSARFGLWAAVLLLWYPTFQYITLYEFEMLRFSIPILLWMLYFFETRRTMLYLFFVVLAILVREEVGLTVAMFGLYILFVEKKKIKGIATAVLGLGGFFIITQMAMPLFCSAEGFKHIAAGSFSQFGETPVTMIKGMLMHPQMLLTTIFHPVKFANIGMLFLPLMFIPLLAPAALIGILANIGVGLVSDSLVHTSYMLYYVAPSVPFIFYAFLKGWPKLIQWLTRISSPTPLPETAGSKKNFLAPQGERIKVRGDHVQVALMVGVLAGLITANIFFGPSPISLQFWFKNVRPAPFRTQDFHYSVYKITDHHKQIEQFIDLIPDNAIVSAQQFIHPRLFKKKGAMIFPQLESKDKNAKADYVLIDRTNNYLNSESPAYINQEEFDSILKKDAEWVLIKSDDGYELYKRVL